MWKSIAPVAIALMAGIGLLHQDERATPRPEEQQDWIGRFLRPIGQELGVGAEELRLLEASSLQGIVIGGSLPDKYERLGLPAEFTHSFTKCIELHPGELCQLWLDEHEHLKQALLDAVEGEDWAEVRRLANELEELQPSVDSCREPQEPRTICIEYRIGGADR